MPENWNNRKLSFYLDKIEQDSPYQEVALKLEPLKKDLYTFSEEFEQFKFGQAALSKDTTSDADAFDDAMEVESFDSQVQTLYWHRFIYKALESFILRYYLTLVSSTVSIHAVRYLSTVFEPALTHVIDMSVLFDGSFDTDLSKKRFRKAFVELQQKRVSEQSTKKIKTKQGVFETYTYNLPLIVRHGVPSEIGKNCKETSFWWLFIEKTILGKNRSELDAELSHTPYQKIAQSISDTAQETESLSKEKIKRIQELADLKEAIKGLNQEMATLDQVYKKENPAQIKEQLKQRSNQVDKNLQDTGNQLKKLMEAESGLSLDEKELAEERDKLAEEEKTLKNSASKAQATVKKLEAELKKANGKKTDFEAKNKETELEKDKNAAQYFKVLLADIEEKTEKLGEASHKLEAVNKKLTAMADRRVNEITKGFERTQAKHTEIREKIEALELNSLNQKKLKKQIQEEEIALEERDTRYAESKKKIDFATKNAEKNQEKDTKTVEDIAKRITDNIVAKKELQEQQQKVLEVTQEKLADLNSMETRASVLMHILSLLITCSKKRKEAWQKVLERFKQRLLSDQELAQTRVEEIKKESQKKLREMGKKSSKLQRLKQAAAVKDFEKEMEVYQQNIDQKCRQIIKFAKQDAVAQKERITQMFHKISKDKKKHDALTARRIFDLVCQMEGGEQFKNEFMDYLVQDIAQKYQPKLEPLYRNLFAIFKPTLLKKVSLIQALNRSGEANGIQLELSDEEQKGFDGIIQGIKNSLRKQKPDIFECQAKFPNINVTIDGLLKIKLNNSSLLPILNMTFSSPKNPKAAKLHPALLKKLLELNHIMTPVAVNNLVLEGKENERDPAKQINTSLLKKLISE